MPTSSAVYTLGFLLIVAGLAYAAHLAGLSTPWVVAGVVVLLGVFLLRLSRKGPPRDPTSFR